MPLLLSIPFTLAPVSRPAAKKYWSCAGLMVLLLGTLLAFANTDFQQMKQLMQQRYGDDGVLLLERWNQLIVEGNQQSPDEQIHKVNEFFNQNLRYIEDLNLWKKSDYWATPLETIGTRAGDCEDYTIAKYLTLLRMGVPSQHLRLIYVRAQIGGMQSKIFQAHMVLGYYAQPDSVPLIMDSLVGTIEPANRRPDLRPVFSFNSEGLWVGDHRASADPTARLSRWRDLLARVQEEGF
jgi:predicted transglutaminase-like cysteine proteinase